MIQDQIKQKLDKVFQPIYLDIINDSYRHNVLAGSESHFRIILVSDQFFGLKALARHRMIYSTLEEELNNGVHALALHLYTLKEWEDTSKVAPVSSPCVNKVFD